MINAIMIFYKNFLYKKVNQKWFIIYVGFNLNKTVVQILRFSSYKRKYLFKCLYKEEKPNI